MSVINLEPVDGNLTDLYALNTDQMSTTEIYETDGNKKNIVNNVNDRNVIPQSMNSWKLENWQKII